MQNTQFLLFQLLGRHRAAQGLQPFQVLLGQLRLPGQHLDLLILQLEVERLNLLELFDTELVQIDLRFAFFRNALELGTGIGELVSNQFQIEGAGRVTLQLHQLLPLLHQRLFLDLGVNLQDPVRNRNAQVENSALGLDAAEGAHPGGRLLRAGNRAGGFFDVVLPKELHAGAAHGEPGKEEDQRQSHVRGVGFLYSRIHSHLREGEIAPDLIIMEGALPPQP